MNQQEKKYARERIEGIKRRRELAIDHKHIKPAVRLSDTERLIAFKKGAFKVHSNITRITPYTDVVDIVTFVGERDEVIDHKRIDAEKAELHKEYHAVMDELMLGDSEQAIRLIAAFDK